MRHGFTICSFAPSRTEAVRRMIHFAETQSVKLPPGEKVKDLVEGHRY